MKVTREMVERWLVVAEFNNRHHRAAVTFLPPRIVKAAVECGLAELNDKGGWRMTAEGAAAMQMASPDMGLDIDFMLGDPPDAGPPRKRRAPKGP